MFGLSEKEILALAGAASLVATAGASAPLAAATTAATTAAPLAFIPPAGLLATSTGVQPPAAAAFFGKGGILAQYAEPAAQTMGAVGIGQKLMPDEQQLQAPQVSRATPNTILPEMVGQNKQIGAQRMDAEMQRRIAQRERIKQLGAV